MNCWVCGRKTKSRTGYCVKHSKQRLGFIKKIQKKKRFVPLMKGWSYKALKEYSEATDYLAAREKKHYMGQMKGIGFVDKNYL